VEIEDDDCKLWRVTGLIKSLTVASTSAAEVEGVDVTFGPGGGFSGTLGQRLFLAVGAKGGEAINTNIAARSVRDIDVGKNSGVATNTYIAVKDSVDERGIFVVGYIDGKATDTTITVAGSLNSVVVGGGGGGEARNTNIAADSLGVRDVRGSITVGSLGTAIDTTIALGAGNDRLIRVALCAL
jgi:hypothetical protein